MIVQRLSSSSKSIKRPPPKLAFPEGEDEPPSGKVDVGFAALLDCAETLREGGEKGGGLIEGGVGREGEAFEEVDYGRDESAIGGGKRGGEKRTIRPPFIPHFRLDP